MEISLYFVHNAAEIAAFSLRIVLIKTVFSCVLLYYQSVLSDLKYEVSRVFINEIINACLQAHFTGLCVQGGSGGTIYESARDREPARRTGREW